jgi:hypothetical protein
VVLGVNLSVDGYVVVTTTGAFLGLATRTRPTTDATNTSVTGGEPATDRCSLGSSHDAVDWRQIRPVECRLLAPLLKAIVREAVKNDCTAIAFKNLKHVCKRISNASKFQQWVFKEIQRYVECKAEEYGT